MCILVMGGIEEFEEFEENEENEENEEFFGGKFNFFVCNCQL